MKSRSKLLRTLAAGALAFGLALAGCAGDDGDDGANGVNGTNGTNGTNGLSAYEVAVQNGFTGTEEEWLASLQGAAAKTDTPREACLVCHGDTGLAEVETVHNVGVGDLQVNNVVVTPNEAGDLVVTFEVRFNGVNRAGYTTIARDYRLDGTTMERRDLSTDGTAATLASVTVPDPADEDLDITTYTITIAGGNTAYGAINSRYLLRIEDPTTPDSADRRAIVSFDYPAAPVVDVLGDVSCAKCHGSLGAGFHYGYPAGGGKACVVCHDAVNTNYPRYYPMIHGIHNSHNMPTGQYPLVDAAGQPVLDDNDNPVVFSIGFPSYMNNCSLCHSTPAALAVINAEPVTYDFCMTCHQNWDGFGAADFGGLSHTSMLPAANCGGCHDGAIAPDTHSAIHNAQVLTTARGGLIWDGVDVSVTEGARIAMEFIGVTRTGNNLAITWGATVDGVAVDPCNTTAGPSAPTFQSGFSILKAFYQGDDLANANNGNAGPGQPNSTNLDFTAGTGNTVCAANVATTTVPLTTAEAALTGRARISLQGRPKISFAPADQVIDVRAKSPVYDFNAATGAAATARRIVVDNQKCIDCHLGSLYQHGGNRIDNEELCMMCHNESSSEQNRREGMGVDASEAYDGKAGQTYGFKTMLHAIHATGDRETPIVFYRNNGIYAFAGSEALLKNWPGTGVQTVFGSNPEGTNPVGTTRVHNFATAHFPRRINDCAACHVDNFNRMPNPTQALATTIHAGVAPYDNQLDDALEGATAAACGSCHTSTVGFEQSALKAHFYSNGWVPQVFEAGRQTVINAAQ